MFPCPDILQLQALADGQLREAEARALTDHVAACPACAEKLRELRLACLPLHLLTEAPPADLEQRLREAVRDVQPLSALTCAEALEWVSLRLDGELDHSAAQRLEAHLQACGACYRAATEMAATVEVLRATEPEGAPAGLLERIEAATELAAPPRPQPARTPVLRRWAAGLAGMAAAAALFLAVLFHSLAPVTQMPAPVMVTAPQPTAVASVPTVPTPTVKPGAPTVAANPRPTPTPVVTRPTSEPRLSAATAAHIAVVTPPVAPRPAPPALAHVTTPARPPAMPTASLEVAVNPRAPVSLALAPPVLPEARLGHSSLEPVQPVTPEVAAPGPVRAATDVPKPTPREVAAAPAPAPAPARTRSHWVSRPASTEREIYRSDDVSTRLADARGELARDAREVSLFRAPGITIIR